MGPEHLSSDFTVEADILSRQRLRLAADVSPLVSVTRRRTLGDRAFPVAGHLHRLFPPSGGY